MFEPSGILFINNFHQIFWKFAAKVSKKYLKSKRQKSKYFHAKLNFRFSSLASHVDGQTSLNDYTRIGEEDVYDDDDDNDDDDDDNEDCAITV